MPTPVPASEVWRLVAPWAGHVFLAAVAVLGLATASGAADDATYASGLGTFVLAAVLIVWRVKRQLDGRETGFLLAVMVQSSDALFVTVLLLGLLGLVGGALAATIGGALYPIGLALVLICVLLIFLEIKRFFDAREYHP